VLPVVLDQTGTLEKTRTNSETENPTQGKGSAVLTWDGNSEKMGNHRQVRVEETRSAGEHPGVWKKSRKNETFLENEEFWRLNSYKGRKRGRDLIQKTKETLKKQRKEAARI